jgi:hypothetical protein
VDLPLDRQRRGRPRGRAVLIQAEEAGRRGELTERLGFLLLLLLLLCWLLHHVRRGCAAAATTAAVQPLRADA